MWGTGSCRAGALVTEGVGMMLEHEPCLEAALLHVCSSAGQVWQRRLCLTPARAPARQKSSSALGMHKAPRGGPAWGSVIHIHEMWLLRYGWSKAEVGCWKWALVAACYCTSKFFQQPFLKDAGTTPTLFFKFWSALLLNHEILSGKRPNTTLGLISEATSRKTNCADLGDSVGNLRAYSLRSALTSATCVPWVMKQPSWETNFWSPRTNPSFQSSILPSGDMTLPNPHGRHGIALYTVYMLCRHI